MMASAASLHEAKEAVAGQSGESNDVIAARTGRLIGHIGPGAGAQTGAALKGEALVSSRPKDLEIPTGGYDLQNRLCGLRNIGKSCADFQIIHAHSSDIIVLAEGKAIDGDPLGTVHGIDTRTGF